MRAIGLVLMVLGTAGSAVSAAHLPHPLWEWFGLGLGVLVTGTVLNRLGHRGAASATAKEQRGIEQSLGLLGKIVADVRALDAEKGSLDLEQLRLRLDAILTTEVFELVEHRRDLLERLGSKHFAEVFGVFSLGERFLNRVWSAAADGVASEAHAYLERALPLLEEAEVALREWVGRTAPPG